MGTGPGDEPPAPGRDRLRAGHAGREQVIEALKAAFVQGRLTRDELGARAGRLVGRHPARRGSGGVRVAIQSPAASWTSRSTSASGGHPAWPRRVTA